MNWRDAVFGGLITLIVTIVSGLAVWWLTANPLSSNASERLVYTHETISILKNEQGELQVVTIRLANAGAKAAKNVSGNVQFPSGVNITEMHAKSSADSSIKLDRQQGSDHRFRLEVSSLAPSEIITISILVRGTQIAPISNFRSDETIATQVNFANIFDDENKWYSSKANSALIISIFVLIQLAINVVILKNLKKLIFLRGSANNSAFVLMHHGAVADAERILESQIEKRGSAFEVANFGLAIALKGDYERANCYLRAAEWWSNNRKNVNSLIHFNAAIIESIKGNDDECVKLLNKSFETDRKEIEKYIAMTKLLPDHIKTDQRLNYAKK